MVIENSLTYFLVLVILIGLPIFLRKNAFMHKSVHILFHWIFEISGRPHRRLYKDVYALCSLVVILSLSLVFFFQGPIGFSPVGLVILDDTVSLVETVEDAFGDSINTTLKLIDGEATAYVPWFKRDV